MDPRDSYESLGPLAFAETRVPKSVRVNGNRIIYDWWERSDLHPLNSPRIYWYAKDGGVAGEAPAGYQSSAAARLIGFGYLAATCFFWAYFTRPDKPIKPGDNHGYIRFEHFVTVHSWIAWLWLVAGCVSAALVAFYLPETIRAVRSGIGRLHRALIIFVPVAITNITLAGIAFAIFT